MNRYMTLMKPGIALFITITAGVGYLCAAGSVVDSGLFAGLLLSTCLLSAGAAATNQIMERHQDAQMQRTRSRPLPARTMSVHAAVIFAAALVAAGGTIAFTVLPMQAAWTLVACYLSYVVYTLMKKRSSACTLVGGIPGALPVLAGWLATGAPLTPGAVGLVAIMFFWQMPHFLSIGWLCREDYKRAGFHVVSTASADGNGSISARICVAYTLVLVPVSLFPFMAGIASSLYFAIAFVCGTFFLWQAIRFAEIPSSASARRLFFTSLAYLPVVFAALVAG